MGAVLYAYCLFPFEPEDCLVTSPVSAPILATIGLRLISSHPYFPSGALTLLSLPLAPPLPAYLRLKHFRIGIHSSGDDLYS